VDAAVPWRVRDAAWLLALGLGTLLLSLLAMQGFFRLQGAPATVPSHPPAALARTATALFYLAVLAGVWLFVVRRYDAGWPSLGLRLPERRALPLALLLFLVLALGCVAIIAGLTWALGMLGLPALITPRSNVPVPADPLFIVAVVGSTLLTPVAEEMLFRGVLYQSLRKHTGAVCATFGSAVLFTVVHWWPAMVPEFLFLGIVLAVAFERTRSLYPSMVMHAAYNAAFIVLTLRVV
jgi:membrane protease YdiL (CAAX protease family)